MSPRPLCACVLDQLSAFGGTLFGLDLTGLRREAAGATWSWGGGDIVRADGDLLVALLSGRTLPDGRAFKRAEC